MDDRSDDSEAGRRRTRASLVERAAEKMMAARGGAGTNGPAAAVKSTSPTPASTTPADAARQSAGLEAVLVDGAASAARPAAGPAPVDSSPLDNSPFDGSALDGSALDGSPLERSPGLAAVVGGSGAAEEAAAAGDSRRRSRMVKVDTVDLESRGIITPGTKRSRTLEEFRLIKRMVLSQRWDITDAPGNTVLVTSALPAEGKTTTAINLAMSIAAEEDLRVLLIDADFVKPDALRQLGVSANKGLIDVLQNPQMDIADVMLKTDIDTLSLIPSGQLHDRCTELLASARMSELIKDLASRYEDRILIFDSPPILATSESVVMTSHVGQIVFVVQAGRTKRESVDSALELIGPRQHLGLVLNRSTGGFGNTEFGAYYGSYYYGYGDKEPANRAAE